MNGSMKMGKDIGTIIDILKKEYPGATTSLAYDNPLNLLVATILSAQCTDKMVNKVTPRLFRKYKSARDYADADIRTLMGEIRSIGLYKGKAKNIKKTAEKIYKDFDGKVPRSIDELVLLPGVGRKTANIVLSNAFGVNEGIAVDTHVRRVSKRLGLTDKDIPDKIEQDLMKFVPRKDWGMVNHLLVSHGRAVCRAKDPDHDACCIRRFCRWYEENV
jgi:endonuclease-3